jgi:hypothetical protein
MEKRLLYTQHSWLLIFFIFGPLIIALQEIAKPKLTSALIRWLDNKPLALDCAAMGDILHVRRELRKMQCGVQDPVTKEFIGFYLFEGQMRTLHWLAEYERNLEKEFNAQKEALNVLFVHYVWFHDPYLKLFLLISILW